MQLARTCYELKAKTMDRKILEMALARRIESRYSKDFILTSYLNRIFFGQGCYGIAQAARKYFGKNVADLNLVECATLAGLVRGPSIYNPISDPEAAVRERNATIDRMVDCGYISEEEGLEAKEIPLTVASSSGRTLTSYPIIWINRELDLLSEERIGDTSGIFALTSVDLNEQRELERICEKTIVDLENSAVWQDMPKRVDDLAKGCLQVAALCVDSKSGNVVSVVGGRCPLDHVDRWVSKKRPGAMFLPLVNVAADTNNINIVRNNPISTGRHVGYRRMMEFAKQVGINEKLPAADELYQGLFSMPLIDMARLAMIVQQNGRNVSFEAILRVATSRGALLYSSAESEEVEKREVLPRETTRIVSNVAPFSKDMFTKQVTMSVQLPEGDGYMGACIGGKRAVFVWLGFDENGKELQSKRSISSAIQGKALSLARSYYSAMMDREKQMEDLPK
jgi:penicillin-binding protein 1A